MSEQNARASAVNRFASKFAKVCAIPFKGTDLPKGELTGNPVRLDITKASATARAQARQNLGVGDETLVAVWSGSLGAKSVNDAVSELASLWADKGDRFLYHIVGRRYADDYSSDGIGNYKVVAYEDKMQELLAAADIAICRSGASTVAELAIAELPSLLIPLPNAPRDHQRHNLSLIHI